MTGKKGHFDIFAWRFAVPYDKRVKLLLKRGMLIILLRNLKHNCSHHRTYLVKKSC